MAKTSSEVKNRWNAKNYDRIVVMASKGKKEEWTKDEELAALRAENLYLKKLWTLIQKENEQIKVNEKENSEPVEN